LALSRERKEELVDEYTELLNRSVGLIFTEYRGMPNKDLTRLRRAVRDTNGAYHVTKMTLFKRALEPFGVQMPAEFDGVPIGVTFCLEDVPPVAKALRDFARTSDLMRIRGGLMGDTFMDVRQVEAIADLPSIEVLRSQILGLIDAPAASLVGVIQSGVSQIVNVLHALEQTSAAEAAGD
jgi:large subunit ribosomal protein L10